MTEMERLRRIQVERLLAELVEAIAEFSNDPYQKWPEYRDARAYFRGEFQPPDPATRAIYACDDFAPATTQSVCRNCGEGRDVHAVPATAHEVNEDG